MPIVVRNTIDPAEMVKAWSAGIAAGGSNWVKGVESPRRMFNADPAANARNWIAGVSAPSAVAKFEAGQQQVDLAAMAKSVETVGKSAYVASGAKSTRFAKKAPALAAAIQAAVQSLPPRGPKGTNSARGAAFGDAMHAKAGTI